jgi:hypothetical protein
VLLLLLECEAAVAAAEAPGAKVLALTRSMVLLQGGVPSGQEAWGSNAETCSPAQLSPSKPPFFTQHRLANHVMLHC